MRSVAFSPYSPAQYNYSTSRTCVKKADRQISFGSTATHVITLNELRGLNLDLSTEYIGTIIRLMFGHPKYTLRAKIRKLVENKCLVGTVGTMNNGRFNPLKAFYTLGHNDKNGDTALELLSKQLNLSDKLYFKRHFFSKPVELGDISS